MNWTTELISWAGLKAVDLEACGWRECYFNWLACGEIELSIWYQHPLIKNVPSNVHRVMNICKVCKNTIKRITATLLSIFSVTFWLLPEAKDPVGIADNQLRGGMLGSHLVCVQCNLCTWLVDNWSNWVIANCPGEGMASRNLLPPIVTILLAMRHKSAGSEVKWDTLMWDILPLYLTLEYVSNRN